MERDHEKAFYEASKWVYEFGSEKLLILWDFIEKEVNIPRNGTSNKLRTSFSYSLTEVHKKEIDFTESLISILNKGG